MQLFVSVKNISLYNLISAELIFARLPKLTKDTLCNQVSDFWLIVGGPAQNMANFEMWCNDQKSGQTCSVHSPDSAAEVLLKKIGPFMVY